MLDITNRSILTFGQLLTWHLDRGTCPDVTPDEKGVPWQPKAFAIAVGKHSSEGPKHERTVRNWRSDGTSPSPADFAAILQALFGGKPVYADWRAELTEKYHGARIGTRAPPTAPAAPSSLPTKPLRCLGRDDELRSVIEALTAGRDSTAVLVLGGAGMGKTTVTREAAVAPTVIDRFGHRRWFVELETAPNAEALEKAIIVALGLDPASARFDAALARLGETPGLLVLDNLETPWDGEREKVEALLASLHRLPQLAVLASIRGNEPPAGVRWTRQRTMHPLEAPHDAEMFRDIASDIKADDPDLAPLLTLLGGVPIAIELVAQQAAPHDTLAALHAEWQRAGSTLARRRGVASSSKLSSLDVSLELSFQSPRLGEAGRRLFALLGQLPAGIAAEDLSALLANDAFDARQGLLSSGLGFERSGRLDLLPPVRDHARRQHPPSDAEASLWREHYLALAQDHGKRIWTAEGAAALQRVAGELPNLDATIRAAITAGESLVAALDAVAGIVNAMAATGRGTTAGLHALAEASRTAHRPEDEALVADAIGFVALSRSDAETAKFAFERALPLYRKVGNIGGEAQCVESLGDIARRQSDHEAARKAYEQALSLYRQIPSISGEAQCIKGLGDIALERPDHAAARKMYEQALPLYQQVGDILGEANCIQGLGDAALRRSDHETALKTYEHALTLHRQIGSVRGEANCIKGLGDIARDNADELEACKLYEQALALLQRIQEPFGIGWVRYALASVTEDAARAAHRTAAKEALLSISRDDLVKEWGLSDA